MIVIMTLCDASMTLHDAQETSDLPNIQTSDAVVNLRKLIDSGAIHLIGSFPFVAVK